MTTHLPDFVIAGAPRSGTTWLYQVLDRHPDIWMARPLQPEPKFFLVDAEYEKGLEYYSQNWFADSPRGAVLGEKSANYLESPTAAQRMADSIPSVRLIFLLREPAERARSNYLWSRMNGLETLTFAEALRTEAAREASYPPNLRYARPHSYFSRGLYAKHLREYLARFSVNQILVLRYEDVERGAPEIVARVQRFVEVAERRDLANLGLVNESEGDTSECDEVMATLRDRYREPNAELAELLGAGFEIWRGQP